MEVEADTVEEATEKVLHEFYSFAEDIPGYQLIKLGNLEKVEDKETETED